MTQKTKIITGMIGFVIIMAVLVFVYNQLTDRVSPNLVDETSKNEGTSEDEINKKTASDFMVTDKDGKQVKLSDIIAKGKPVVLNFWASWCPPCKREMPEFEKVYQEMKDEVEFVMVDLTDGQRETTAIGKEYIKSQGFSFPVYFDTNQEAAYAYSVSSIPSTYFIDKEGINVKNVRGAMNEKDLREAIELIR